MAKIIGNTTATPNPRPDWAQTDETKADYIKNKPEILTEEDVVELIAENGGGSSGSCSAADVSVDESPVGIPIGENVQKAIENLTREMMNQSSAENISYYGPGEYIDASNVGDALHQVSDSLVNFNNSLSLKSDSDHIHNADEIGYMRFQDENDPIEGVEAALNYLFDNGGNGGVSTASDISVTGGEESYTNYGSTVQETIEVFDQRFLQVADIFKQQSDYFIPHSGVNLCNYDTMVEGYMVGNSDGKLTQNASYISTDYIDVSSFEKVSAYSCLTNEKTPYQEFFRGAFYDENKNFVSGINNNPVQGDPARSTQTIPSNAKYIRVCFMINQNFACYMVVGSDSIVNFEDYAQEVKKIPNFDIVQELGDGENNVISQKAITDIINMQADYFIEKSSVNKCNPDTMLSGYMVGNSDGKLSQNASYISTDFIDISDVDGKISVYSCDESGNPVNPFFRGAFYNEDEVYISGLNNNGKDGGLVNAVVSVPDGAKYLRVCFILHPKHPYYMVISGDQIINHVPYTDQTVKPIPTTFEELKPYWQGKVWASYGDSITAMGNDGDNTGWQKYVSEALFTSQHYGRGIGGQTYKYNKKPWFANADGSYNSREDSGDMTDSTSYTVPSGCTAHYGYFASWDRISTMFPDDIKDTIDLIFVFGVNDGSTTDTCTIPEFSTSNVLDEQWASATENTLGGDYDLTTLEGAIASTMMKLQARCPNALIVFGTGMSGRGDDSDPTANIGNYLSGGLSIWREGKVVKELCNYFSTPVVDIWGTTGVNPWNRNEYITDVIHPYSTKGKKALARAIISGLLCIYPRYY